MSIPILSQCGATKYREVPQIHENWDSSLSRIGLALTHACRFFLVAQQVSFWENEPTLTTVRARRDRGGKAMSVSEGDVTPFSMTL